MYDDAKTHDVRLPVWTKLASLEVEGSGSSSAVGLREIRQDGLVPNSELLSRGFKVGEQVYLKEDKDATLYTIDTSTRP